MSYCIKNICIATCLLCINIPAVCQGIPETSGFIKAGSLLNIYYKSTGAGKPVILLHAGLQDNRMWDEQLKALAPAYRVITIDLPGHGKTIGVDTVILIADVIKTVMDSLNIQEASVMGLSLGSVSATDFALAYPQKVEKLILVSPGLVGWQKHISLDTVSKQYFEANDRAYATKDSNIIAQQFTKTWCDGPNRKPSEVKQSVRNYILQTTMKNVEVHHLTGWPNFSTLPAAERAGAIQCPVLIIHGDKDIQLIINISNFLHNTIKGSQQVIFPNVAHMLNMEVPGDLNRALLKFLKGR